MTFPLPDELIKPLLLRALEEDLGQGGDLTTLATIGPDVVGTAQLNARETGIVAGIDVAALSFRLVDPTLQIKLHAQDGDTIEAGTTLLTATGSARSLLTAERTALNMLSHLCGIASLTARYVGLAAGTNASIAGTRKTLPGLRLVQKHAIRCGGAMTHRMSLSDAVMIKDNHVAAAGGIAEAVAKARFFAGHTVKVELEVDTLDQLRVALPAGPDIVLLDNMTPAQLQEAVTLNQGSAVLEASGGVNLETVRSIAETGVDIISVGALTHSVQALDIGMELVV